MKYNQYNKFILLLFFLFPILTATVREAGSILYTLLGLLSFLFLKKKVQLLEVQEKRFLIGLAVFFGVSCLSLFMTEDLSTGVKRFERYGRLLLLIPIYLMLRKEPLEAGKALLAGAFSGVFVMLGQSVYQVEVLNNRVSHGAYHKIIFGNMAIFFTTLIVIGVLHYGRHKLHYFFGMLGMSAGLYASLLSGTRTAWFFVPFILVVLLLLYRKRLERRKRILIGFSVALFFLLIAIWPPKRLVRGLRAGWVDVTSFSENAPVGSLGARFVMWRNSLLIFKESPIFGTGVGDFRHDSKILLEKGLSYKNKFAVNQTNAHSIYFMLLAEGGAVGLSILIVTLFVLPFKFFYGLWKNTSDKLLHFNALLGLVSIIAFAWFGVSESWINRNPMVNAYCMAMLAFMSSAANRAEEIKLKP